MNFGICFEVFCYTSTKFISKHQNSNTVKLPPYLTFQVNVWHYLQYSILMKILHFLKLTNPCHKIIQMYLENTLDKK